ncbi:hypothetical protein IW262DRAFT_1298325 [Armillaria fumosa]|nr:hypothetical protein IW262DRAFT_1298325 [Armillaria fumosa]
MYLGHQDFYGVDEDSALSLKQCYIIAMVGAYSVFVLGVESLITRIWLSVLSAISRTWLKIKSSFKQVNETIFHPECRRTLARILGTSKSFLDRPKWELIPMDGGNLFRTSVTLPESA